MFKKSIFSFCLLLLLCVNQLQAQLNIDSALTVIRNMPETRSKVGAWNDLAWESRMMNPQDAEGFIKEGIALGEKLKDTFHLHDGYSIYGNILQLLGQDEKSIEEHEKSLELRKAMNAPEKLAGSYNNIGIVYHAQGQFTKALEFYLKSEAIYKEIDSLNFLSEVYNNIGILYYYQGDLTASLKKFKSSLEIKQELNENMGVAMALDNIGNVYMKQGRLTEALGWYENALHIHDSLGNAFGKATSYNNIGLIFREQGYYDIAKSFFEKGLSISKETGLQYYIAFSMSNLGVLYAETDSLDLAFQNLEEALVIYKDIHEEERIADNYMQLGQLYLKQNQEERAREYFMKSREICQEIVHQELLIHNDQFLAEMAFEQKKYSEAEKLAKEILLSAQEMGLPEGIRNAANLLYKINEYRNDYEAALSYHKLYSEMKDSLANEAVDKKLSESEMRHVRAENKKSLELLSKEKELQALRARRNRNFFFVSVLIAVLLGLSALLFISRLQLKAQRNELELKQQLLRLQMNPHFLFNCLNSIQSIIYRGQPDEAALYLSHFARLMRIILEGSRTELIPLDKELNGLSNYMELQKLRFEDKFEYEIVKDPDVEDEFLATPPMLAQPFIENALEHGINHLSKKGHVFIHVKQLDSEALELLIKDNGVGREQAAIIEKDRLKNHQSLAMSITSERIAILRKKYGKRFSLQVEDVLGADGKVAGTQVRLTLPIIPL